MATIEIKHFDDLKTAGLAEPEPQRLLLVLLRAEPEEEGTTSANDVTRGRGTLTPVAATDKELTPELDLAAIVEEADSLDQPWQLMLVSSLAGRAGAMPNSEQASPHLEAMVEAVMTGGDLSRYAAFDRAGSPVRLTAESASGLS